jgi:hypothetical protein
VTQPEFVPPAPSDRVRPAERLATPSPWYQTRPGDLTELRPPTGPRFGTIGPDPGYGLKLAKRFEDRLVLSEGESAHDAVAGAFACGLRRSADFGRAPVIYDMEWAYALWGFLGGAPEDLVAWRAELFRGASHQYWDQREIVDAVKAETVRLTAAEVRGRLTQWKDLFVLVWGTTEPR